MTASSADKNRDPNDSPDTAAQILAEARILLRDRGADHVTVTEIARRLGMSHSNVYRFFPNKAALLDTVMAQWLTEGEEAVATAIAEMPTPADRLAAYILALDDEQRRRAAADARAFAAYADLSERTASAMEAHAEKCRALIMQILHDGIAAEMFDTGNVEAVARAIDNATLCLRHPKQALNRLRSATPEEAEDLVVLLLDGIRR